MTDPILTDFVEQRVREIVREELAELFNQVLVDTQVADEVYLKRIDTVLLSELLNKGE